MFYYVTIWKMLRNTFCHIPGIGYKYERRLWEKGILSWDACMNFSPLPLKKHAEALKENITESMLKLKGSDPAYFAELLAPKDLWRIFPDFRATTAYLDIETNGYVGPYGYITAITLYDGTSVYNYIRGENLEDFKRDIKKYNVIVTYNGKCFDVPFIESHMRLKMPQAHIDLRYVLKDLGFSGGLKRCEKTIGIDRGDLDGVDGYFAVLLWKDYRRNKNPKALETLIAYNVQDVVNLEPLLIYAYNQMLKDTPFASTHRIPDPSRPRPQFKADTATIERILSENSRHYPTGL